MNIVFDDSDLVIFSLIQKRMPGHLGVVWYVFWLLWGAVLYIPLLLGEKVHVMK